MQSTSVTNAETGSRSTIDDDQRGMFFFGSAALSLVTLGLERAVDAGRAVDASSPLRERGHAHASGCP